MANYSDTHWGQLVCTTDNEIPAKELVESKFTIGRAKTCDWSLDNKLVSGQHCRIERDDNNKVWLIDNSTNGTLVNMSMKITKGQRHELKHGDEVYIVYKKEAMHSNVGFLYQDCEQLDKEAQDYSSTEIEQTFVDEEVNAVDDDLTQPMDQEEESSEPVAKKQKTDDETDSTSQSETETKSTKLKDAASDYGKTQDTKKDNKCEDDKNTDKIDADLEKDPEAESTKESAPKVLDRKDAMEETLMCSICQDILHDSVSLQPCLHSFCSGCYSDWMDMSNECPLCCMKVERINKNHLVNNLVEIYLKDHPDKKRTDDDIASLDAKNKITRDMLYKDRQGGSRDSSDDSDEDNSYSDDNSGLIAGNLFGLGAPPVYGVHRNVPNIVCRQCPAYVQPVTTPHPSSSTTTTPQASTTTPQPSTSTPTTTTRTTPPPYVCVPSQNHVLCACCIKPMPDRRTAHHSSPDIPAMTCDICSRNYCHAYWGCDKVGCNGCLARFRDLKFNRSCLTNLILDNQHESSVFQAYIDSHTISLDDVLKECITKVEQGQYTITVPSRITGNSWVCYTCGVNHFKNLAYLYRAAIPDDDLPVEVTARPNCHWGKNCRTQKNKPHHAQAVTMQILMIYCTDFVNVRHVIHR